MSYESYELKVGSEVELELLDDRDRQMGTAEITIEARGGEYWLHVNIPVDRKLGEPYGTNLGSWLPLKGVR